MISIIVFIIVFIVAITDLPSLCVEYIKILFFKGLVDVYLVKTSMTHS